MGFFRDLSESKLPENADAKNDKKNQEVDSNEEEAMSDFDDANVDKDLLSQIFGGEQEDDSSEETKETAADDEKEEKVEAEAVEAKKEAFSEDAPVQTETASEDAENTEEASSEKAPVETASEETTEKPKEIPSKIKLEWEQSGLDDIPDRDVTVITKGTTINGGISSDGSLEIMGTITGDVECQGKVSVYGTISGNVTAENVVIKTRRLEGNIKSGGTVEIAQGTIVVGDIVGTSANISGAINGNIDVNGPVVVNETSIVKGSIKAKSIQVNSGAVLDGYCSLNYAGVDLDDFFSEK